eukprot:g1154.t1
MTTSSSSVRIGFDSFTPKNGEKVSLALHIAQSHCFSQQIEMIVPSDESEILGQIRSNIPEKQQVFYLIDGVLSEILAPAFLSKVFCAVSHRAEIDHNNTFAVIPGGLLVLCVDCDTFEQLGLPGEPILDRLSGRKTPKATGQTCFSVTVDIGSECFRPGDATYDRVKWCIENRIPQVQMLVCSSTTIDFPKKWKVKEFSVKQSQKLFHALRVPALEELATSLQKSGKKCGKIGVTVKRGSILDLELKQAYNWIGAVASRAEGLLRGDVEPYVSTFTCNGLLFRSAEGKSDVFASGADNVLLATGEAESTEGIGCLRYKGFMPNSFAIKVIGAAREIVERGELPWAVVSVWGFFDSPCNWLEVSKKKKRKRNEAETEIYTPCVKSVGSSGEYIILIAKKNFSVCWKKE